MDSIHPAEETPAEQTLATRRPCLELRCVLTPLVPAEAPSPPTGATAAVGLASPDFDFYCFSLEERPRDRGCGERLQHGTGPFNNKQDPYSRAGMDRGFHRIVGGLPFGLWLGPRPDTGNIRILTWCDWLAPGLFLPTSLQACFFLPFL